MKDILYKLAEATARIERVILIAGAIADESAFSDDIDDFFDDEDEEDIEKCLGKIPDWVDLDGRGYERSESIYEWLTTSGRLGFLVKFATPVMTPTGSNSRSFSWGYYSTTWVYADTFEAAIDKGMKWVETRRRAEEKKAKAKKEGAE